MDNEINFQSTAVQQHINILQDIITRLANNSNNCKKWCLAITAAILTLLTSNKQIIYCYYATYPIITCCILDAYYLCMERAFRREYKKFIDKLHQHNLQLTDLYNLKSEKITCGQRIKAFGSLSIWLFYSFLIIFCIFISFVRITQCIEVIT